MCLNSFKHWVRMANLHGGVDPRNLPCSFTVTALSLLTSHFQARGARPIPAPHLGHAHRAPTRYHPRTSAHRHGLFALSQRSYEKNVFTISEADIEKADENWKFARDAWGYGRPRKVADNDPLVDMSVTG